MLVSFIGLGNMGAPLAKNIMAAGESLMVYGRTPRRLEPFREAGAQVAAELSDLAACDVLCTCLPLPEHVAGTVLGENGLYADLTTTAGRINVFVSQVTGRLDVLLTDSYSSQPTVNVFNTEYSRSSIKGFILAK